MPNDLIAVIKQKQAAIAKLQAELDEARALLVGALGGAKSTPVAPKQVRFAPFRSKGAKAAKAARQGQKPEVVVFDTNVLVQAGLMPTGSVARAVDVLREAGGQPMYVLDIIKEIERRHGEKVKKDTLVGNISRYIKAGKLFYRAGPNVYGLLEMKTG